MKIWSLLKDILLTGTGVSVIISQMFVHSPSDAMLVTGLALTVPTLADHAKSVLSSPVKSPEATPEHGGSAPSP